MSCNRALGTVAMAACCAAATPALALSLDPVNLTVDCTRGQTITRTLNLADLLHRPLVLTVRGTCTESVTIDRDDITLRGDASVAGMVIAGATGSAITVRAHRVVIDRLAIRGGSPAGIALVGGSDVEISNSDIQNAAAQGIQITGNSAATISNSSIQNNTRSGVGIVQGSASIANTQIAFNAGNGVRVRGNSSLNVSGGSISSNAWSGIDMESGTGLFSGATINGNGTNMTLAEGSRSGITALSAYVQLSGSSVTNNTGSGILVTQRGSLSLYNSTVSGNGAQGVFLYLGAAGNVSGSKLSGNGANGLWVSVNSTAQVTLGAQIQNNAQHGVLANAGSKVWVFEPSVSIGGNGWFGLYCNDSESSAAEIGLIVFAPANGAGPASCTGY